MILLNNLLGCVEIDNEWVTVVKIDYKITKLMSRTPQFFHSDSVSVLDNPILEYSGHVLPHSIHLDIFMPYCHMDLAY